MARKTLASLVPGPGTLQLGDELGTGLEAEINIRNGDLSTLFYSSLFAVASTLPYPTPNTHGVERIEVQTTAETEALKILSSCLHWNNVISISLHFQLLHDLVSILTTKAPESAT